MGLSSGWRVVPKRAEKGREKKRGREIHNRGGKKGRRSDAPSDDGVIFIKNVPRACDGSYVIVALTAAKLRLRQPKSRPRAEARCASIKAITLAPHNLLVEL